MSRILIATSGLPAKTRKLCALFSSVQVILFLSVKGCSDGGLLGPPVGVRPSTVSAQDTSGTAHEHRYNTRSSGRAATASGSASGSMQAPGSSRVTHKVVPSEAVIVMGSLGHGETGTVWAARYVVGLWHFCSDMCLSPKPKP